ncbi:MAG: heme transporter CcmC, partial [Candidatus Scalindua sp.]
MNKKLTLLGLIAGLCLIGTLAAPSIVSAGEAQVIATIQTGPEWEPLGRGEPLTVPEVHYRVKHSPYKSELVRYGQFQFNEASWTLQGEYSC